MCPSPATSYVRGPLRRRRTRTPPAEASRREAALDADSPPALGCVEAPPVSAGFRDTNHYGFGGRCRWGSVNRPVTAGVVPAPSRESDGSGEPTRVDQA